MKEAALRNELAVSITENRKLKRRLFELENQYRGANVLLNAERAEWRIQRVEMQKQIQSLTNDVKQLQAALNRGT